MSFPFSIGSGYDVHRFTENRPLILCGVEIPYDLGLEAHSDGDVVFHALTDALLGAAALGDIGKHFPPEDNTFKNIDSRILLEKVLSLLKNQDWKIGNVDITIIAQAPKIGPFIEKMCVSLSQSLGEDVRISIKATTTEKLGFTGRKEGIAAHAVALIFKE